MDLSVWRRERPVFLLALQFLTRLPVTVADYTPQAMAASPRYYPAVGVLVGLATGIVFAGAALIWPPVVAALLAVVVGLLITGGLHEDGFADACDGLGGGRTKERALEIMRDSRIGSYGALGLGLMLGARVAVLATLPVAVVPFVLVAGHAASRGAMLWVMLTSTYARSSGAGSAVAAPIDGAGQRVAAVTVVLALLPMLAVLGLWPTGLAVAGLVAGYLAIRRRFEARLGGYTGDCLGAVQQCSEIGLLLGALAFA
jgi:adenosylcobinamide-GDP ribazoletransferase